MGILSDILKKSPIFFLYLLLSFRNLELKNRHKLKNPCVYIPLMDMHTDTHILMHICTDMNTQNLNLKIKMEKIILSMI